MPLSEGRILSGQAVLLGLAILSVGLNTLFGLTPMAWKLMGSPSESYPEFFFIGVGMPLALAALVGGISGLWTARATRGGTWTNRAILWIAIASLLGSTILAAIVFLPPTAQLPTESNAAGDAMFAGLFVLSPGLMIVQLTLTIAAAFSRRR